MELVELAGEGARWRWKDKGPRWSQGSEEPRWSQLVDGLR